jgi:hypothetical protein
MPTAHISVGDLEAQRAASRERARRCRAAHIEQERARQREAKRRQRDADPERSREANRRWREANPEQAAKSRRAAVARYDRPVRVAVFGHYGWACSCCGSTDRPTIDHIGGNGREHRQELFGKQRAGSPFYAWLIKQGFPAGFQTLCVRCNKSKNDGPACRLDHSTLAAVA